jgi:hypothetical protein
MVTAEDKFFDEAGCESCHQKGKRLDGILGNHRVKSGAVVLVRSQDRIREVPDHCHR